jgi:hypothetical protein
MRPWRRVRCPVADDPWVDCCPAGDFDTTLLTGLAPGITWSSVLADIRRDNERRETANG